MWFSIFPFAIIFTRNEFGLWLTVKPNPHLLRPISGSRVGIFAASAVIFAIFFLLLDDENNLGPKREIGRGQDFALSSLSSCNLLSWKEMRWLRGAPGKNLATKDDEEREEKRRAKATFARKKLRSNSFCRPLSLAFVWLCHRFSQREPERGKKKFQTTSRFALTRVLVTLYVIKASLRCI